MKNWDRDYIKKIPAFTGSLINDLIQTGVIMYIPIAYMQFSGDKNYSSYDALIFWGFEIVCNFFTAVQLLISTAIIFSRAH